MTKECALVQSCAVGRVKKVLVLLRLTAQQKPQRHRLNMELDLQNLFGLLVHSCTHWHPLPPPAFELIYEGAMHWSAKIDDISL
jgi:hypothetical protein